MNEETQVRKITYSLFIRLFILFGGIALVALFGGLFFKSVRIEPKSVTTWALFLPLFIVFTVAFILGTIEAFRASVVFGDDVGLIYTDGITRAKHIPTDALESFLVSESSIFVTYAADVKGVKKSKKIHINSYYKNLGELAEWLSQYAKDEVAEQIQEGVKDFETQYGGLSDEEKGRLYRRAHRAGKILNRIGYVIALAAVVGVFKSSVYEFPLRKVAMLMCCFYPLILLFSLRISNGLVRFNTKETDIYPSVLQGFCVCAAVLLVFDFGYINQTCNFSWAFCVVAIATATLYAFYYFCADKAEFQWKNRAAKILNVISVVFILAIYAFGAVFYLNYAFPQVITTVSEQEVKIIDGRVSKGKNASYYKTVSPWIDGSEKKEIEVSEILYADNEIGESLCVTVKKGLFGITWYTVRDFAQESDLRKIMEDSASVILEPAKPLSYYKTLPIAERFGEAVNPISGEPFFRDYIAFPYYSIRKFCSALDGEITKISGGAENGESSVSVRTGKLEIEYFGCFHIEKNLSVGGKAKKGECLGVMFGGGDGGMVLKIRMRYDEKIVDPTEFFDRQNIDCVRVSEK